MTYDYNQFLIDLIIQGEHHLINNLHNPSFDQLKQLVDKKLFKYFKDDWKSEEICLYAVGRNGYSIRFIINQSEEVQIAAVMKDGYAIQFITNPSEKVQLAAVKQNGYRIKFIKKPRLSVIEYCKNKGII